jgi:two-component system, LytTR family, sensor kinase
MNIQMKKPKGYAPYLFAIFIPIFSAATNNSLSKLGVMINCVMISILLFGQWLWIEWLILRSENRLIQLVYLLIGVNLYSIAYIGLDHYVLQLTLKFTGRTPLDMFINLFLAAVVATILIENIKWNKAKEKAQIENLTLQSENIEAKFKLLREQVNPEFLFYCLTNLQNMVKADNPQVEIYILKLADVYRQTLKKDVNVATLREELALLESYMFLMRHGREAMISFEVEVAEISLDYRLPIFALQLLGDNCIKHNVFSEKNPLHIRIFQENPYSITMTNNYQRNEVPKSFGIDIEHLTMRYALEGVEDAILIEKELNTYSTTIKLF